VTAEARTASVAIVDYGLGNLFSIQQACRTAGIRAIITGARADIERADAVILPGMGAFGDAMATLRRLGLVEALRESAASGKPLLGVCLGVQLLMSVSYEFGRHEGLDVIPGEVVPLAATGASGQRLKIPQVGWNRIHPKPGATTESWAGTPLEGVRDGQFMYFVHSYVVVPEDPSVILSTTTYGSAAFCSSVRSRNVFACQFHPERSGHRGLDVYRNLSRALDRNEAA
jgi:glutamine amidotransferase